MIYLMIFDSGTFLIVQGGAGVMVFVIFVYECDVFILGFAS